MKRLALLLTLAACSNPTAPTQRYECRVPFAVAFSATGDTLGVAYRVYPWPCP